MKARYYFIAIAALIAGACSRNADLIEEDIQQITFTAYQEGYDAPTKTTVLEGGTQVYWEANDEVKLFYNGVGSRFTSTNTEPVGVAQFTGSLSTVIGFNEGFSNDNPLWGLYPYRADATSDGASVTTTLPAEQSGRAGSFAKNTHITLGRSTSLSMGFYAVSGGVRFSLTQEGIKRVTFEGNNGEAIAGKIKIAFVDGVPVVQEVTEDQTVIKLTVPGGGTFQTGQWYYISAIPGTLSGGFTMTFYKESESAKLSISSSVKIKRGIFGSLADADENIIFKPTGVNPSDVIVFADSKVHDKLVAAFDSSGDGELSYEEAEAVTSGDDLKAAFGAIKTYKSFDEFQYFSGVTSIPDHMFENWNLLSSVILPDTVKSIGESAFYGCIGLTTITIPESVNNMLNYVFYGCTHLSSITILGEITSIGLYAFRDCTNLTSIALPESVARIGYGAFSGCTNLKYITIPYNVTAIESLAFLDCKNLESITLLEKVSSIGSQAFQGCSGLKSITMHNGLKTIDYGAFSGCSSLESIVIPNSVTMLVPAASSIVNYGIFYGCVSLKTVVLSNSIQSLPRSLFYGCTGLTSITIPESVTDIGDYAFRGCSGLTTFTIPESVTNIGYYAFSGCTGLSAITIPESVSTISDRAFEGCSSLVSIIIPESITSISYRLFSGCTGLKSITLPESITTIDAYAFLDCSSLTTITIPKSVTNIKEQSFWRCTSLTSFTFLPIVPPNLGYCALEISDDPTGFPIYVPAASLEDYKADSGWTDYVNRIRAIPPYNAPEIVDLGLSVKWAAWNVGASSPEEYGDFFAWGETEGKEVFEWTNYELCNGSATSLTKYNTKSTYGTVDNKTTLESEDDAAHVKWGGCWRMPTDEEWKELRENCTWTWTSDYNGTGVAGRIVTSKKVGYTDKSIFLPATGYRYGTSHDHVGTGGEYWSATISKGSPHNAYCSDFSSSGVGYDLDKRCNGRTVRPVCE